MAGFIDRAAAGLRAFSENRESTGLARQQLGPAAPRQKVAAAAAHQRAIMRYSRGRAVEAARFMPGMITPGSVDMDNSRQNRGVIHHLGNRSPHELDQDYRFRRAEGMFLSYRNPHARTAVEVIVSFAIDNGLNINAKGPRRRKGQRVATKTQLQSDFNTWYRETTQADAHDQLRGFQIEQQVLSTAVHQGGVIVWLCRTDDPDPAEVMRDQFSRDPAVIRRRSAAGPARNVPLSIRRLSTQQLDDGRQVASEPGHLVRNGVEYTALGKEYGYWIKPTGYEAGESFFVPKYNEKIGPRPQIWIQRHGPMLPGQHLPTPPGCTVLDTLTDAADMRGNVVTRTREESRQGHAITMSEEASQQWRSLKGDEIAYRRANGEDTYVAGRDYDPETGEELIPQEDGDISDADLDRALMRISASISEQIMAEGEVPVLPAGWSINTVPLVNATPAIELIRDCYRVTSIAYRVPYSMLTHDSSQANFSADKMILGPFYSMIRSTQESMILEYATNVTSAFTFVGWTVGRYPKATAEWSIRGVPMPSVEPEKDLSVTIRKLANRLTTLREEWEKDGKDPDEMEMALEEQDEFLQRTGAYDRALPFSDSPQFLQDKKAATPATQGNTDTPANAE